MCARTHPLGAAPNFHAWAEKKDKSAHAHVGVHEALDIKNNLGQIIVSLLTRFIALIIISDVILVMKAMCTSKENFIREILCSVLSVTKLNCKS